MKTLGRSALVLVSLIFAGIAQAQTSSDSTALPPGLIPPGPSARDGFTRSGTDVFYTRHGITAKVTAETALANGVRVAPDGTIKFPDGTKATLRANELLTLDGRIATAAISPSGTAPVSPVIPGTPTQPLTASNADGITLLGTQAFVTRNGVTSRLVSELRFENGLRVRPNGSMTLPNGTESSLTATQLINFRGQVVEAPPRR